MELSTNQQIFDQLGKANRVLIALPPQLHADNLGSALALSLFLKKMGKEVDMVSAASTRPETLAFLPGTGEVKQAVKSSNNLVVSVNTSSKELEEISYQTDEAGKVNIYIKPKTGTYTPEDVTITQEKGGYSIIVIFGCTTLPDLGETFEKNADTFFETPKINIDNHPGNEYFGAINLVDINCSSLAEILTPLLLASDNPKIDEDMATCLLTGIIANTGSFQHSKTTPSAFMRASELIALGARQQEIVKFLYKTKSLSLLKLWGRALARLKIEEDFSLVYSLISLSDIEKSGSAESDMFLVLKEFVENISGYKTIALLVEQAKGSRILLALHTQIPWEEIVKQLGVEAKPTQPFPQPLNVLDITLEDVPFAEIENKFQQVIHSLPKGL